MGERYERRPLYMGRRSIEEAAKSGLDMQQSYIGTSMFPPKKEMQFKKGWIKLGYFHRKNDPAYRKDFNAFVLDWRKPVHTLVMGATGSGKTNELRRMGEFAFLGGFGCAYITDVADEMKYGLRPVQAHLAKLLDGGEIAQGLPIRVYRPVFFRKILKEKMPSQNAPFQLAYGDLTVSDIETLMGYSDDKHKAAREIIEACWDRVSSLEELRDYVDKKYRKSHFNLTESILRTLEALIRVGAVGRERTGDFVQDIVDGFIPVLNVQGFGNVGKGSTTLPQVYVSVIMRLIVEARQQRRIPRRVVVFVDEAPRFLVEGTLTFREMQEAIDTWRKYGIYLVFAAQTKDRIPDWLIDQSRIILLPWNTGIQTVKGVLGRKRHFMYHPNDMENIDRRMRRLEVRQWVCVDGDTGTTKIFHALPSLSGQKEPAD